LTCGSGLPTATIRAALRDLEQESSLLPKENFLERARALDFIDFHLLDALAPRGDAPVAAEVAELLSRTRALQARLAQLDRELITELREEIRAGRPSEVARLLRRGEARSEPEGELSYDFSDVFVNTLFGFELDALQPQVELEPEMVFFQATPVRRILELIDRARVSSADVLVDLGSGIGRVPMLVALLTGARAIGIEREPIFCAYARDRAEALGIPGVEMRNADAREADFAVGSVFFMYHPFTGAILEAVLKRLREQTAGRVIRLCTLGRCTFTVAQEEWLVAGEGSLGEARIAVFSSR
jgi:hypothetical protein